MRILLVEDDGMIGEITQAALSQDRFAVDWVRSAEDAELALLDDTYDFLILDIGLPGKSGIELLRELRQRGSQIPVLLLTAMASAPARVEGLDAGSDDYLVKPFELKELAARIRAVSRRQAGRATGTMQMGSLELNPASHVVTYGGKPVNLSHREFMVLQTFMENPRATLSREQLEAKVYGWNADMESNAIEVHVHHLRRKLKSDSILTVRGVGYRIAEQP